MYFRTAGTSDAIIHPLCMTDDQGTVLSHGIKLIRMILKQNTKGIGSLHPVHDLCDRLEADFLYNSSPANGRSLRYLYRIQIHTLCLQLLFQFQIILNDPVMYHNDTPALLLKCGCAFTRTVLRVLPSVYARSRSFPEAFLPMRQLTQHFQSALCFFIPICSPSYTCDPCRIIIPGIPVFPDHPARLALPAASDITLQFRHT